MEFEIAMYFLATLAAGAALIALTFWFTRGRSRQVRANLRSLALAVALTPSIAVGAHNLVPMPAIVILVLGFGLLSGEVSWTHVVAFGALPIALVWAILRLLWPDPARRD